MCPVDRFILTASVAFSHLTSMKRTRSQTFHQNDASDDMEWLLKLFHIQEDALPGVMDMLYESYGSLNRNSFLGRLSRALDTLKSRQFIDGLPLEMMVILTIASLNLLPHL